MALFPHAIRLRLNRCRRWSAAGLLFLCVFGTSPTPAEDASGEPPRFLLAWGREGEAEGEFKSPIGIAASAADELYVTDAHGNRVQKFSADGKFLASFQVPDHPGGIAVDPRGNVHVAAMLGHKICVFTADGKPLREWGKNGQGDGEFVEPGGIAIDRDGLVYVADQVNRRVQKFDAQGRFLLKWGEYGSKPGQFDGKGALPWRIGGPQFLAFDRGGNLYTTEALLGRIQKWTREGKYLAHWGDNHSEPGGFGGREKLRVGNPFPGPIALCFDHQDRVWISSTNNRVQLFTSAGKYLVGFGKQGIGPGEFLIPHGLAIDSRGNLYVVDSGNHRVQKFAAWAK